MSNTSPLIIGGVGGSGTRIYRKIAQLAGYKMLGAPWWKEIRSPERYHDNYLMRSYFYPKWLKTYMQGSVTKFNTWRMRVECRFYLWLCGPLSYNRKDKKWGFKNPNTLLRSSGSNTPSLATIKRSDPSLIPRCLRRGSSCAPGMTH